MAARSFELLCTLVGKEFKVRYKNTALGFLWSVAHPVFFALVFYFVFSHVFKVRTPNYLVFLLAGMFPWQCVANTLVAAPTVYLSNASLVKRVYFPRIVLPMAVLGNNLIHFLLAVAVAIPVLWLNGFPPTLLWLAAVPLLVVVQCAVAMGLSLVLSSLNVVFRDLEHLNIILVNLLFFVTPVMYSIEDLPEGTRAVLRWNPMYYVIPPWQELVLRGRIDWGALGVGSGVAAVVMIVGYGVYRRLEARFAEYL